MTRSRRSTPTPSTRRNKILNQGPAEFNKIGGVEVATEMPDDIKFEVPIPAKVMGRWDGECAITVSEGEMKAGSGNSATVNVVPDSMGYEVRRGVLGIRRLRRHRRNTHSPVDLHAGLLRRLRGRARVGHGRAGHRQVGQKGRRGDDADRDGLPAAGNVLLGRARPRLRAAGRHRQGMFSVSRRRRAADTHSSVSTQAFKVTLTVGDGVATSDFDAGSDADMG